MRPKKKLKNYEDFAKFSKEYKVRGDKAILLQEEWNYFWIEKDEKFRSEFYIQNTDLFRDSNMRDEKYNRRMKLIAKNVIKIRNSVRF